MTLRNLELLWTTRKVSSKDLTHGNDAEDGTNVDNWTMDEIIGVVDEFIQHYNSMLDPTQ